MGALLMATTIGDTYTLNDTTVTNTKESRFVDAVVYPQGYVINGIELPRLMGDQKLPQKGSMILVMKLDEFRAKMITIMRDPPEDLKSSLRCEGPDGATFFREGERQLESKGRSFMYLDNDGNALLSARTVTEQFYADASTNKTWVRGMNVELSNGNTNASVRVVLDKEGNLILKTLVDPITKVEKASIKIDSTGKVSVNTTTGSVEMNSTTGGITINAAQDVTINSTKNVEVKSVGNMNITGGVNTKVNGVTIKLGDSTQKMVNESFKDLFNNHDHFYLSPTGTPVKSFSALASGNIMTPLHLTRKTEAE